MTHENSWGAGAQRWSGKEHIDPALAVEAERQGEGRVAVIDIDPQQTSVKWSKRRVQLGKQTPVMLIATATDLQEALEACEASGMTFVLIDTPPHVEAPCREAAKLVDLVVIPCGPSAPDLEAIGANAHEDTRAASRVNGALRSAFGDLARVPGGTLGRTFHQGKACQHRGVGGDVRDPPADPRIPAQRLTVAGGRPHVLD